MPSSRGCWQGLRRPGFSGTLLTYLQFVLFTKGSSLTSLFFFFFNVMSPLLLAQRPGLLLGRGGSSLQPWAEARVRVLLQ